MAQTYNVEVDPGKFVGRYRVSPSNRPDYVRGRNRFALEPGVHWVDTGPAVGGSELVITVDARGDITHVHPPDSARVLGQNELHFSTQQVVLQPGSYRGSIYITLHGDHQTVDLSDGQDRHFHAVTGMHFAIDNTGRLGGTYFYAWIDASGTLGVSNHDAAATLRNRLTLKTAEMHLVPHGGERLSVTGLGEIGAEAHATVVSGLLTEVQTSRESLIRLVLR